MKLSVDVLASPVVVGFTAALGCHAVFVQRDPSPSTVFFVYAILWLSWPALQTIKYDAPISNAIIGTVILITTYTFTLLASIGIYRVFFHRLRRFPGPLSLTLSKWSMIPTDIKGHRIRLLAKLHQQHGNVVRVGPRELSINDPTPTQAILGAKSTLSRGPSSRLGHARSGPRGLSLTLLIDWKQHRQRRRIWDRAFSVKALKNYEPSVRTLNEAIMRKFEAQSDEQSPLKVDDWCVYLAYDVMGQVGFSKSFDMTGQGQLTNEISIIKKFLVYTLVLGNIPYVGSIISKIPSPMKVFDDYAKMALEERLQLSQGQNGTTDGVPDIFAYLLGETEATGSDYTKAELANEASLIVLAGSDTTSSTLTFALFELARSPIDLGRLRVEIEATFADQEAIDNFDTLAKQCPFLNAVIDETLRMYPAAGVGFQREVPWDGEGVNVPLRKGKNVFLPPGTVVSLPATLIHRDPRNYGPDVHLFRPSRWLPVDGQPHSIDRMAFVPFNYGPTSCVGKQLALMEMRIFLANFVTRFDFTLPKDFDVDKFKDGIVAHATTTRLVPLQLHVTKRSG